MTIGQLLFICVWRSQTCACLLPRPNIRSTSLYCASLCDLSDGERHENGHVVRIGRNDLVVPAVLLVLIDLQQLVTSDNPVSHESHELVAVRLCVLLQPRAEVIRVHTLRCGRAQLADHFVDSFERDHLRKHLGEIAQGSLRLHRRVELCDCDTLLHTALTNILESSELDVSVRVENQKFSDLANVARTDVLSVSGRPLAGVLRLCSFGPINHVLLGNKPELGDLRGLSHCLTVFLDWHAASAARAKENCDIKLED